jgi:malate dehydrogenase (oxaloacetate-decarboxylating)
VAAAKVLADVSPAARDAHAPLLPPVARLREVAFVVAKAVAREARAEGQCEPFEDGELDGLIARKMWDPVYRPYRRSRQPVG